MESKDLVKKMSMAELRRYCEEHSTYHLPDANEAETLESEHCEFWVDEALGDRCVAYNKKAQTFRRVHPAFLMSCVVIRDKK